VALLDLDPAGVNRTAEAIGLEGGEALAFTNDITDSFAVERTLDRVIDEWGRIDVLVNNAGVLSEAPLEDLTDEDLEESLDINLRGTLVCTRATVPHMVARGAGRVISAASMSTRIGAVGLTAYSASKGAIVGMTRTWARELGPKGITANAVAPGLIDSETTSTVPAGELEATLSRLPARRLGRPDEVAAVYVFLASDLSSFINGAVLGVDGGLFLV
jgi:3-oxoacyl-[acyl-carrier protein] reductase